MDKNSKSRIVSCNFSIETFLNHMRMMMLLLSSYSLILNSKHYFPKQIIVDTGYMQI